MVWFGIKAALAALSVLLCLRMVRLGDRPVPSWVQAMIVLLSLRPIMSDLHHGNNNIIILFLVVATLAAWRKGYDVLAGLILAYAIAFKVTPGLFLLYFAYKRSWRTVGATALGMGIFLLIVPSLFLGPGVQRRLPGDLVEPDPQPLRRRRLRQPAGDQPVAGRRPDPAAHRDPRGRRPVRGPAARQLRRPGTRSWSAGCSRCSRSAWSACWPGSAGPELPAARRPPAARRVRAGGPDHAVRLGAELEAPLRDAAAALHVPVLPGRRGRPVAPGPEGPRRAPWSLSALMIATTSSEMGGLFARHQGHKIAQAYGMFLWSGVVLYVATAWRVRVEGRIDAGRAGPRRPASEAAAAGARTPRSPRSTAAIGTRRARPA